MTVTRPERQAALPQFSRIPHLIDQLIAGFSVTLADPHVCDMGVHACRASDLPYWLGCELWEVELAGEVVEVPYKLVASRGRLRRRLPGWPELERPFAQDCAARVRDLAAVELRRSGLADLATATATATTDR